MIRPDHTFTFRVWSDVGHFPAITGTWEVAAPHRTDLITTISSDCEATQKLSDHHRIGCQQTWRIDRGGAVRWGAELVRHKGKDSLR